MPILLMLLAVLINPSFTMAQNLTLPIIDMHLHAMHANSQGPPPVMIGAPYNYWPDRDTRRPGQEYFMAFSSEGAHTKKALRSPVTDDIMKSRTLEILERRNIIAVTSGNTEVIDSWRQSVPERIFPSLTFPLKPQEISSGTFWNPPPPDSVKAWYKDKRFSVLGEFAPQYDGISPSDSLFEPVLSIAEELDVPLGIHIGPGPPGYPYISPGAGYRARLHSPLVLEEALIRHPKARIYIMHAGWPMLDDTIAMLYVHPQLYVDLGIIDWAFPRAEFYRYLRGLVDAGFEKRIMFGSDNMIWPDSIELAIQSIETAPFLNSEQKRDILYNNAARFLRLSPEEIARQHGKK